MEQHDVNNGKGNEKSTSEIIFLAIMVVRENMKARTQRSIFIYGLTKDNNDYSCILVLNITKEGFQ